MPLERNIDFLLNLQSSMAETVWLRMCLCVVQVQWHGLAVIFGKEHRGNANNSSVGTVVEDTVLLNILH